MTRLTKAQFHTLHLIIRDPRRHDELHPATRRVLIQNGWIELSYRDGRYHITDRGRDAIGVAI